MVSTVYTPVAVQTRVVAQTEPFRSGIWLGIFAITMSFAAFTSALYVRQGSGEPGSIVLPPILYANTLALLLSSCTMEVSRRAVTKSLRADMPELHRGVGWLVVTLLLGLAFVGGQFLAWRHLASQGLYLATNSNSSFFYVFTAMHGLHLLGGIAAIVCLIWRVIGSHRLRRSFVSGVAIYWHFMGVLWLYLLIVIYTRLGA
jgi:cytochrome c oxidase subunit 3